MIGELGPFSAPATSASSRSSRSGAAERAVISGPGGGSPCSPGSLRQRDEVELAQHGGVAGLVWAAGGRPRVVFSFTLTGGKITAIDLIGDPGTLGQLDVVPLST